MKKHILICLTAIALLLLSCSKPDSGGANVTPTPTPVPDQIDIPSIVDIKPVVSSLGGEVKVSFTATGAWTVSVVSEKDVSWVDLTPKNGNSGSSVITIMVVPNNTYEERNATVQIKCGSVTKEILVTQKQFDNISLNTNIIELAAEGGTFSIDLKSNVDVKYEIDESWIRYVSTKAYSGKIFTFTAEPNQNYEPRRASIVFSNEQTGLSQELIVNQEGKTFVNVTEVSLDKTSASLKVGETITLAATVNPSDATDKTVTWSTSDAKVASVSNGLITAKIIGNATITAKAGDKTASCEITVVPTPVTSVTLDKTSVSLKVGETITLAATVNPSDATDKTVTWSTSDAKVALVENGVVSAKRAGSATITAKAGEKSANCIITVSSEGLSPGIDDWGDGGKNNGEAE